MPDVIYTPLDAATTQKLLTDSADAIAPVVLPPQTTARVADLPFYEDFKLYELADPTRPAPNLRYLLHKTGHSSLLNWTNEPIYAVNEVGPIKLDRKTVIPYAKFFFHYVRGQLGRFIIVENRKMSRAGDRPRQPRKKLGSTSIWCLSPIRASGAIICTR